MKNNKSKSIYKMIVGLCSLAVITLPLISLTSCASTWSIPTPIACGSVSPGQLNDPYLNLRTPSLNYDRNGVDIASYLPSNYMFDPSNGYFYANCAPVKDWETKNKWINDPNDSTKKILVETDIIDSKKTTYDPMSWYKMPTVKNDETLKYSKTVDVKNPDTEKNQDITIHSYQNWSTIYSMNVVNVIAQSIAHLITQPLIYTGSLIASNDFDMAWTGKQGATFEHGVKGGSLEKQLQNNNFYEFLYALSNSSSVGKNNSLFKNVSSNFNFITSPFVTFKEITVDEFILNGPTLTEEWTKIFGMNEYATAVTSKDGKKITYTYENVPLVIEPTNLLFTYVDTESHSSYFPNDYYQTNIEDININNAWSTMSNYTDVKDPKPTNLKYEISLNQPNRQMLQVPAQKEPELEPKFKYDRRLELTNKKSVNITNNPINLEANRFIMPMSFTKTDFLDKDGEVIKTKTIYENLSSNNLMIYPAYFLNLPDVFKQVPESKNDKGEVISGYGNGYILDGKKLAEYEDTMLKTISSGTQYKTPSKISSNNEWILNYIPYLFSDSAKKIDTNNFILPIK